MMRMLTYEDYKTKNKFNTVKRLNFLREIVKMDKEFDKYRALEDIQRSLINTLDSIIDYIVEVYNSGYSDKYEFKVALPSSSNAEYLFTENILYFTSVLKEYLDDTYWGTTTEVTLQLKKDKENETPSIYVTLKFTETYKYVKNILLEEYKEEYKGVKL